MAVENREHTALAVEDTPGPGGTSIARPGRRLIVLMTTIFLAEGAIMPLRHNPSYSMAAWVEGVGDALLLTLVVFPVLYVCRAARAPSGACC